MDPLEVAGLSDSLTQESRKGSTIFSWQRPFDVINDEIVVTLIPFGRRKSFKGLASAANFAG